MKKFWTTSSQITASLILASLGVLAGCRETKDKDADNHREAVTQIGQSGSPTGHRSSG
jgi:hypothetical protein